MVRIEAPPGMDPGAELQQVLEAPQSASDSAIVSFAVMLEGLIRQDEAPSGEMASSLADPLTAMPPKQADSQGADALLALLASLLAPIPLAPSPGPGERLPVPAEASPPPVPALAGGQPTSNAASPTALFEELTTQQPHAAPGVKGVAAEAAGIAPSDGVAAPAAPATPAGLSTTVAQAVAAVVAVRERSGLAHLPPRDRAAERALPQAGTAAIHAVGLPRAEAPLQAGPAIFPPGSEPETTPASAASGTGFVLSGPMEVPGLPQVALQPSRVPGDEAGEDPSAIAAEATADTSGQEAVQLPKFPQPQPVDGRVTAPPPDRSDARLAASEPSRLASEVRSIAFRGLTEAQLQLEPAELGSVAVHIALDGGRVSVVMTVDTPHGLEALQAQAPVLRESFQQLGMQLDRLDLAPSGSTAWSDGRTGQEGRHPAEQTRPTWRFPGWGAEERLDGKSSLVPGAHAGMVDYRI